MGVPYESSGPARVISTNVRERPAIYPTEFRTEYEQHQETVTETIYETVHVPDPANVGRTLEKLVPRDISKTVEKLVPKDWVTWVTKGSSISGNAGPSCSDKIDRLKKNASMWEVIEPAYNAWKLNQQPPDDGTPLDTWPGVTPQQVRILRDYHLRSVEDFATAPDSALVKMNIPGIREMQKRAQRFLEAAGFLKEAGAGQQQFAVELSRRDETIGTLQSELADMRSMLEILTAPKEEEEPKAKPPPRIRHRPKPKGRVGWPKGKPRAPKPAGQVSVPDPVVTSVSV